MCNPALIIIGAQVAGGVMQSGAEREAGREAERAAKTNAMIAEAQAEQARTIGDIQEQRVMRQVRAALGGQRAAFGAGNVELSGTAAELQEEAARGGATDAYIARANALRDVWGFGADAAQQRAAGRSARRTGEARATSTLLTTASNAYGTYRLGG